jgi:dephospho-CoA kinase
MAARLRIGLTGGIASGKSAVAQRFAELGVPVIDADESARIVVAPGSPGLAAVIGKFGENLLTADGTLDRRLLRDLIFSDPGRRRELEAILHPLIRADMERRASAAFGRYLVMAIPLLIESGGRGRVDRVLVIDVDEEVQLKRLMERDGGTMEQAKAILAAQAGRATRLQAADDVLENMGSLSELRHGVDQLHRRYVELAGSPGTRADHLT